MNQDLDESSYMPHGPIMAQILLAIAIFFLSFLAGSTPCFANAMAACEPCRNVTLAGTPCHDPYGYYSGSCHPNDGYCPGGCPEPCLVCDPVVRDSYPDSIDGGNAEDVREEDAVEEGDEELGSCGCSTSRSESSAAMMCIVFFLVGFCSIFLNRKVKH